MYLLIVLAIVALGIYIYRECKKIEEHKESIMGSSDSSYAASDRAPNKSFEIAKAASSLATSTMTSVLSLDLVDFYKYLRISNATRLDAVLFSCFILRAVCIMSSNNRRNAVEFSNEYVSSVINMAKDIFFDSFDQEEVDNRFALYDRIFAKHGDFDKSISALLEEFEYIIMNDIIHDKFASFSESSPLPILGIDKATQCSLEVRCYFKALLSNTKDPLEKAIAAIR